MVFALGRINFWVVLGDIVPDTSRKHKRRKQKLPAAVVVVVTTNVLCILLHVSLGFCAADIFTFVLRLYIGLRAKPALDRFSYLDLCECLKVQMQTGTRASVEEPLCRTVY